MTEYRFVRKKRGKKTQPPLQQKGSETPAHRRRADTPSHLNLATGEFKRLLEDRLPGEGQKPAAPAKAAKPGPKVLIIESDAHLLDLLGEALTKRCDVLYDGVKCVATMEQARELLQGHIDAVVLGYGFREEAALIGEIRARHPEALIIRLTTTDLYKKITAEYGTVGGNSRAPPRDMVHPFARYEELADLIVKACEKPGGSGTG